MFQVFKQKHLVQTMFNITRNINSVKCGQTKSIFVVIYLFLFLHVWICVSKYTHFVEWSNYNLVKNSSDVCIYNSRVSFQIRSLLFGAVYTDAVDSKTADLASLACASDTEEDGGTEEWLG